MVYIREAHAIDSFLPKGGDGDPIVLDPRSLDERRAVAEVCMAALELEDLPTVIDDLDDTVSRTYDAWPDRLFLVGGDGRVTYHGPPGPTGFDPDALEQAILQELQR